MTTASRREQHHLERPPSLPGTREARQPREDLFQELGPKLRLLVELNPGQESQALRDAVERRFPGRLEDSQLPHALNKELNAWASVTGTYEKGLTDSLHMPGRLGISEFILMDDLKIIVAGRQFDHFFLYFTLPYSNWETGTVCLSDSFESLSQGVQNALSELGGVPEKHCTIRRTSAMSSFENHKRSRRRYHALLAHYGLAARAVNSGKLHERFTAGNHEGHFKQSVEDALEFRGSREFGDRAAYEQFLRGLFDRRNGDCTARLAVERPQLRDLPDRLVDAGQRVRVRVTHKSTIRVRSNTYSVPTRLIGLLVDVHLAADCLEVWQGEELVETLPRLRGQNQRLISSRHLIGWLASDPKAFATYPYREALFPTSRFRQAYDVLLSHFAPRAREN
jgi:hypothetical protein